MVGEVLRVPRCFGFFEDTPRTRGDLVVLIKEGPGQLHSLSLDEELPKTVANRMSPQVFVAKGFGCSQERGDKTVVASNTVAWFESGAKVDRLFNASR